VAGKRRLWFVKTKCRVVSQALGGLQVLKPQGFQRNGSASKRGSQESAQNPECSEPRRESTDCKAGAILPHRRMVQADCVAVMQAAYPRPGDHLTAFPRRRGWNSLPVGVSLASPRCVLSWWYKWKTNTDSTESREIRYPWHPWCGRSV